MDCKNQLHNPAQQSRQRQIFFVAGLAVFFSGLIYYATFRSSIPWPGYLLNLDWAQNSALSDTTQGSYPSFAFCASFGLWAMALFSPRRNATMIAIGSVFGIAILLEASVGTFDKLDVLAAFIGSTIAALSALFTFGGSQASNDSTSQWHIRTKGFAMVSVATFCASASHVTDHYYGENCVRWDANGYCIEEAVQARAIYLSYADLRSAVQTEEARELSSVSRIYLYKNYLFINEKNEGIHVIDNTTPTSPKQISFIAIPGNTELSIRSDNLYADSYIDLVTLNVSDINNITEVSREESIFPYDAFQNIPYNVQINDPIDSTRGVVIGYR